MAETYSLAIERIEDRVLRVRVTTINFQFSPVPANRCFGLQVLADAFLHLSERDSATNQRQRTAHALAQCADPRVVAWSERLRLHHDEAFHRELVAMAEPVIVRIVELECRNLEKADAWNEANERGDAELVPYSELDVTQVLELEVADARLLAHLVPGLTWQTAMYARSEETFGCGLPLGYGGAAAPRATETYSARVERLFSFGKDFAPPWPNYVEALGLESGDVAELMEIVTTWDLSQTNAGFPLDACGPRHAWRALGQLRAVTALGPLLEAMLYQRHLEGFELMTELPTVIELMGPPAISLVEVFLARREVDWSFKLIGLRGIVAIALSDRTQQRHVEQIANALLANYRRNGPDFNGALVNQLLRLELEDASVVKEVLDEKWQAAAEVDPVAREAFMKRHFAQRAQ